MGFCSFLDIFTEGDKDMNEEQLKAYLKQHLSLQVDTDISYGYGGDSNYETVTIKLMLDGEQIGDAQDFTFSC